MKGEVGSVVGDIEKKGLVRVFFEGLLHKVESVVGEDVGGVPFPVGVQVIDRSLGRGQHFLVIEVDLAIAQNRKVGVDEVAGSVKPVEAAGDGRLMRFRSKVPLAGHHGAVASLSKLLGQGRNVGQDGPAVTWDSPVSGHMPHPRLMLVDPGQQGGPGGATPARVVKL